MSLHSVQELAQRLDDPDSSAGFLTWTDQPPAELQVDAATRLCTKVNVFLPERDHG